MVDLFADLFNVPLASFCHNVTGHEAGKFHGALVREWDLNRQKKKPHKKTP